MTPAARIAAAAEILDTILAGSRAEPALTGWFRAHRFAGSRDRAAIRDHVFDALRRKCSARAAGGGGDGGRALMIGLLRQAGADPAEVFTGEGYAPSPLRGDENRPRDAGLPAGVDCPDWLWPRIEAAFGDRAAAVMEAQRHRAPVFVRVNLRRGTREAARAALKGEGIAAEPHPEVATALRITDGARKIGQSAAYLDGLVELQDAASQAAILALPQVGAGRILDFCAGGGGKSLALWDRFGHPVVAHDIAPARMRDIPARAARAGAEISLSASVPEAGRFDLVLCDAPCSGSGTWRRDPEGKWALSPERLAALAAMQDEVLESGAARLAPGGILAYATCSILPEENTDRIAAFHHRHPGWLSEVRLSRAPDDGGDGFFLAILWREAT